MGASGEVMTAMVAAFHTGDLGLVADIVHPEYLDHQGLDGERPITGVDGFAHVVASARRAYGQLSVTIADLVEGPDRAAARIVWDGVRPSGEVIRREAIDIVRIEGGRAMEHWRARS